MKLEIAKLWTAALRSGEYKQGRVYLCTADGKHCCLGVLTKLAIASGVPIRVDDTWNPTRFNECDALPPYEVLQWSGLGSDLGNYNGGKLVGDNDDGKTFAEIADIIEKHAAEL